MNYYSILAALLLLAACDQAKTPSANIPLDAPGGGRWHWLKSTAM
jgi:hypothetical protein